MLEKHSENEVHVDKVEQGPASSIAFGLERLGLIAVRAPIVSCIVLLVLIVGAVFGIHRIKIDDSLSQLFRSDTREFKQYEEVTKKFPAEEFDVLVVVEGKNLLARDNLAVCGASGAGAGQAAGSAVPGRAARGRRLRQVHRDREEQRDHPRQAVVGRRHAGADRAVA